MSTALELKALGNKAFVAKDYDTAISHFSAAIELDPSNHVLFSNRSACYASLRQADKALVDGEKTIELKPDFWKGYTRKATPLYMMERYEEAKATYELGLKVDPNNATLLKGVEDCDKALESSAGPFGGMGGMPGVESLFGADTIDRIRADPALAGYLNDPSFVEKINKLVSDPKGSMSLLNEDPRMMNVFLALMKTRFKDLGIGDPTGGAPSPSPSSSAPSPAPAAEEEKKEEKKEKEKEPEPEPMEVDSNKDAAEAAKAKGNEAYKAKNFSEALGHYSEAISLDEQNIVYYLNRAAVYMAQKDYDKCAEECDLALANGKNRDFKQMGKALHRKGKALLKKGDYAAAEAALEQSLTNARNADVLKDKQMATKLKKKSEEEAYYDEDKALDAKKRGNEFFGKHQYPEAVKEYEEAIKRNPKDKTLFSNRAAALTKLMAYSEALKDCEKCIELDPQFIKGYTRKATVHFMMKDYHKAMKEYERAMNVDPNNQDVVRGYSQTLQKVQETRGDKDRSERALQDPEIQQILREDQVQSVLQLLKNDPAAAQRAIQANRDLSRKFNVLMSAGLV